ncbi:MAG: hypothetical protein Q4D55_02450 [Eubacteriales bacterium]|nr:hypothetical protein [Eubacteriales bacterium]
MRRNHKKIMTGTLLIMGVFALVGVFVGVCTAWYLDRAGLGELPRGQRWLMLAASAVWVCISVYLQIILHEGGHMIGGLLSGYRFSSFRIGSLMWVKEGDKLHFCRLSLAGTGGQCLMLPPDRENGDFPVVLYNLGGSLANLVSALLLFWLAGLTDGILLGLFFVICAIMGLGYAFLNGVPFSTGLINNDGYNALELSQNAAARRAFWIQLAMVGQTARGIRQRDMPDRWFAMPEEEEMGSSLVASQAVFRENWLMDKKEFDQARELIDELLSKENGIVDLHRRLLICDRIFLELLSQKEEGKLKELYSREQKQFMKQMKSFPTVIRTEYAWASLYERDPEKAKKVLERFEKCSKSYPYPTDVESERELLSLVEEQSLL